MAGKDEIRCIIKRLSRLKEVCVSAQIFGIHISLHLAFTPNLFVSKEKRFYILFAYLLAFANITLIACL